VEENEVEVEASGEGKDKQRECLGGESCSSQAGEQGGFARRVCAREFGSRLSNKGTK